MSNNIYDILKKINKLENNVQTLKESKSMDKKKEDKKDESKKKDKADKGAIAEAVARVEKQLNEKYNGFKKMRESQVEESGLMYHAGVKKHGKKYMDMAKEAGQKGASQEELGRLKDKHSKAYKNKKMDEANYNEEMLSSKQKSFAALAEPKDKITYADKIAGAKKKQKDEGNEFSGERQDAIDAGETSFEVDGKTYPVKEGFPTVSDAEKRMREKEGNTSHGKKTITKTGVKHERDYDAVDRGADVDTTPKGRGRPKKDRFA